MTYGAAILIIVAVMSICGAGVVGVRRESTAADAALDEPGHAWLDFAPAPCTTEDRSAITTAPQ